MLASSSIDADPEDQEAKNRDDLDEGEVELNLAVKRHGQEVDSGNDTPENADEDTDIEVRSPVLDDQTTGSKFKRISDCPGEPVNPTHGKPQTGVNEATGILGERTSDRNISRHLSQRSHNTVDDGSNEGVCNKSSCRSSLCESTTASNEQTSTNGTTYALSDMFGITKAR